MRACRMAELFECFRFDLTNALAGHAEFFSDFFKGMIGCAADTETHAQDALLPRCEMSKCFANNPLQSAGLGRRVRIDSIGRLDQISQGRVAIFTDWSIERGRLADHRKHLFNAGDRNPDPRSNLSRPGVASFLLVKPTTFAQNLGCILGHMHGNADRACLIGNSARNRLADPPDSVGRDL